MRVAPALLTALCILVISGCNKRPEGILSDNEMADLLTDIELAEAYNNNSGAKRVDRQVLIESVLEKHGVTQEILDSTLNYYGKNLDEYTELYAKVDKKLRSQVNQTEDTSEENNIWPFSRFTAFMPNQFSDGISFSIPATGIMPGNTLEWSMRFTSAEGVEGLLGVEYENGVKTYMKRSAGGNPSFHINLQTDTALVAKRLFGTVTVSRKNLPQWADSIRLIRNDFDSLSYSKIRQQRYIHIPPKRAVEDTDSIDKDA